MFSAVLLAAVVNIEYTVS